MPAAARSQQGLISLDRLQIISLGASVGPILPSQVAPTRVYATQADYGPIAPGWRLSFSVSYWESHYRDAVVQEFVDSLNKNLSDTSTSARLQPSRISVFDVTFSGDARYTPVFAGMFRPFAGLGVAAHVINAEGKLIKGTFVERTLDDIAFGVYGTAGIGLRLTRSFGLEGGIRADLVGGLRSAQARAGATYYFGRIRGM